MIRQVREPNALVSQEVTTADADDEDTLPWQVIALLDGETMREVFEGYDEHNRRQRDAAAEGGSGGGSGGEAAATTAAPGGGNSHNIGSAAAAAGGGASSTMASEEEEALAKESDHYKVLGLQPSATEKQIQHAYRVASLRFHPDRKGGSKRAFQRVQSAYETLSDEGRRHLFDNGIADVASKEAEVESWKDLYCPFGDPFVNKRRLAAQRRAKQREEAAATTGKGGKK